MMPDYWTSKPLRELVSISKGKKVITSDTCEQNSIPYIGAKAFRGDFTAFTSSTEAVICDQDDVLILWDGERSGLATTGLHGAVSSTVARLRSKGEVNPHFIYYFIDSKFKWIQERRTGLAVPHVPKDLKDLLIIDLPTPTEQQKIAAILSSVDDAIQATQAVIDQTHRVKQGLLQQLLTRGIGHTRFKQTEIGEIPEEWENTTIGRVTESHSYGPRFSSKNYSENGNVKTIRGTDLTETGEILYKQVPTAMLDEKIVQQHKLLSSDLVVITTADCGRSAIFVEQKMPYIPSAYAVRYRLKMAISPPYIKLFMQTQSAKTQIDSFIRKGTVANLPGSDVLKIKLPLPPLDEQLKILQIFNSIEFEMTQLIEILDGYSKIKKGLMQDLLTGRVRVNCAE